MRDYRTLRVELVLEVKPPQNANLFQALVLAFWHFQGLAEFCRAVWKALEARVWGELQAEFPGRFPNEGGRLRIWELPFGRAAGDPASLGAGSTQFILNIMKKQNPSSGDRAGPK